LLNLNVVYIPAMASDIIAGWCALRFRVVPVDSRLFCPEALSLLAGRNPLPLFFTDEISDVSAGNLIQRHFVGIRQAVQIKRLLISFPR
jgi:hypothetical protein